MRRHLAIFSFVVAALAPQVSLGDGVKGTFVGEGTYATPEGCRKVAALKAGGDKNVSTVPETLTQDGFESWEGGCEFDKVKEAVKDKVWHTAMTCSDSGEEEVVELNTFTRNDDGSIDVQVEGDDKITRFVRCDGK